MRISTTNLKVGDVAVMTPRCGWGAEYRTITAIRVVNHAWLDVQYSVERPYGTAHGSVALSTDDLIIVR